MFGTTGWTATQGKDPQYRILDGSLIIGQVVYSKDRNFKSRQVTLMYLVAVPASNNVWHDAHNGKAFIMAC